MGLLKNQRVVLSVDPARQFPGVSSRDVGILQLVGHRQTFQREVDGAAATGLGFLTAAVAMAAAL